MNDRLTTEIASSLRKPDCSHTHLTWPNEDIAAIERAIDRAGYVLVAKDALRCPECNLSSVAVQPHMITCPLGPSKVLKDLDSPEAPQ